MRQPSLLHKRYRLPGEIISHVVWLYSRFLLSDRDVEKVLADRGIAVSDVTIRRWCRTFGQTFADGVRRCRSRPGDTWHLDEVQLKINGRRHWLWRAVDQEGIVLDLLVWERRPQEAAEAFLRRLVEGPRYQPRVMITDQVASSPPADKNGRCNGSRRRRPRSRLSLSSTPSASTSSTAAPSSPPSSTTRCSRRAWPPGVRS